MPSRASPPESAAPDINALDPAPVAGRYDAVVIGGAFSGAAAALLLKRRLPEATILVVERGERFERKVGEATVEVSGAFLQRELGLAEHLSREHLPKHGLRYWLHADADDSLGAMTEIGPASLPDLPSFQLDRSVLDEHLLARAHAEGVEVRRPTKVVSVDLAWPRSRVVLEDQTVEARWVLDASGRQAFLARRLKLQEPIEGAQTTGALWARWSGAADLDRIEVEDGSGRRAPLPRVAASRRLATNHFCGYGWWCWVIPLARGGTSIGLVYDKDLFEPPGEGSLRARYERFVRTAPGLRELVAEATIETLEEAGVDDFMALSRLPYTTRRYADRGWALLGDAASFIDPFYSPGLDHAAMTISATVRLVAGDLDGSLDAAALEAALGEHDRSFRRSIRRWRDAIYHGKYELFGDADLTHCAFLIDTALYYLGVVTPVYSDREAMANPPFGIALPQATVAYRVARALNRRLLDLARFRRRAGLYGRANRGARRYSPAFRGGPTGALGPLRVGLGLLLRLELERLVHGLRPGLWRGRRARDLAPASIDGAST
ncbi:MAG: tryptophan 7-halogenase [Acidobacteriota bacterium]